MIKIPNGKRILKRNDGSGMGRRANKKGYQMKTKNGDIWYMRNLGLYSHEYLQEIILDLVETISISKINIK